MRVIRKDWGGISRSDQFTIVPIGDVHIGAAACDEKRLLRVVQRVKDDPNAYWVGIGDYIDAINRNDKRFSVGSLAPWLINMDNLADIVKAQRNRFLEIIAPIAPKCLALVEGNHETAITKYCERYVFGEIVDGIRKAGSFAEDHPLSIGYYGWFMPTFRRSTGDKKGGTTTLRFNLHHGFAGGQLAGGKHLAMQRWLWTHDCDLALFGHSHNTGVQVEAVEAVNDVGQMVIKHRIGAYCGTFLGSVQENGPSTYSEIKGYLPLPNTGIEVVLRPGADNPHERIQVITSTL